MKMLTDELIDAMQIVCAACPYISDCCLNEKLVETAYASYDVADPGEKYCERCMVRHTFNLYWAMDNTNGELSYNSPEWQAVINY